MNALSNYITCITQLKISTPAATINGRIPSCWQINNWKTAGILKFDKTRNSSLNQFTFSIRRALPTSHSELRLIFYIHIPHVYISIFFFFCMPLSLLFLLSSPLPSDSVLCIKYVEKKILFSFRMEHIAMLIILFRHLKIQWTETISSMSTLNHFSFSSSIHLCGLLTHNTQFYLNKPAKTIEQHPQAVCLPYYLKCLSSFKAI